MKERKEKRHLQGVKNMLLAFAFCFVCALFVGVSPVYADTFSFNSDYGEYTINVSSDMLQNYPYIYVVLYDGQPCIYLTSDKLYCIDGKARPALVNIHDTVVKYQYYKGELNITKNTPVFSDGNCPKSSYNGSGGSAFALTGSYAPFLYSNTNINYVTYDTDSKEYTVKPDNFFIPSAGVSIRIVEELPAAVISQTRTILPIAVFCLASLIGCLALLPRLRTFLG